MTRQLIPALTEDGLLCPDPLSRTPAYKTIALTLAPDAGPVRITTPRPELVAAGTPRVKTNQCG